MSRFLSLGVLGLNAKFYLRYFLMACVVVALFIWLQEQSAIHLAQKGVPMDVVQKWLIHAYFALCALAYPYARYLYAKIWEFFFDESVWYLGGIVLLIVMLFKFYIRMLLIIFSPLIMPISWIVLYFDNK